MQRLNSILILEDEPDLQAALPRVLKKMTPETKVECATTAEEALNKLKTDLYSLVVSDIILPGEITGIQFWQKCVELYPEVNFCFMSGLPPDFYSCLLPGTTPPPQFLSKPFSTDDFRNMVYGFAQKAA